MDVMWCPYLSCNEGVEKKNKKNCERYYYAICACAVCCTFDCEWFDYKDFKKNLDQPYICMY